MLTSSRRLGKRVSAMPVKSSSQALEILSLYRLTSHSHYAISVPLLSAHFQCPFFSEDHIEKISHF